MDGPDYNGRPVAEDPSMSLPVLFVQRNDAYYLDFSLQQVHATNPGNPIYLLHSNITSRQEFVTYIDIDTYAEAIRPFERVYRHMSTNPYDFEFICFARWFAMLAFCRERGFTSFLYLDPDALLYSDIDAYFGRLDCAFTISTDGSPHCAYFSSISWLERFCRFVLDLFGDAELGRRLEEKWKHHQDHQLPGGVCDMTAFYEFMNQFPDCPVRNIANIENGEVFDDNMNDSAGFRMKDGLKDITYLNGQPYGTLETGERVRFRLLHFQGGAKPALPDFHARGESARRKALAGDSRSRVDSGG